MNVLTPADMCDRMQVGQTIIIPGDMLNRVFMYQTVAKKRFLTKLQEGNTIVKRVA